VWYLNTTKKPTGRDKRQLSNKIMAPRFIVLYKSKCCQSQTFLPQHTAKHFLQHSIFPILLHSHSSRN
jgi:hypothetical protein